MPGQLTYLGDYLAALEARVRPKPLAQGTITVYRTHLARFQGYLAAEGIAEVTVEVLNQFREHLQAGHRPRSVHQAFTALGSYWWFVEERELLHRIPDPHQVWLPELDEADRYVPTEEQVLHLFDVAEAMATYSLEERLRRARMLLLLSLAADCVMRREEICDTKLKDVSFKRKPPRIYVREGKNSNARWVPLNGRAERYVREHLDLRREWVGKSELRGRNPHLFARRGSDGGIDDRHVDSLRHWLLHEADLEEYGIHLHSLRHWGISRMVAVNGVNTKDVAAVTGHKDHKTLSRYIHSRPEAMIAAVNGTLPLMAPPPANGNGNGKHHGGNGSGPSPAPEPLSAVLPDGRAGGGWLSVSATGISPFGGQNPRPEAAGGGTDSKR